ncbi:unnamed protein product, partial [Polarella glacialis]
ALLAPAQPFEWLEFQGLSSSESLRGLQQRTVEFITTRAGLFDGLHFHMRVQLDSETSIDTLREQTTWSTTYVRLLAEGVWLPEASRLICDCRVWLDESSPRYAVAVRRPSTSCEQERLLGEFSWQGSH